jgi:hypothetical protein
LPPPPCRLVLTKPCGLTEIERLFLPRARDGRSHPPDWPRPRRASERLAASVPVREISRSSLVSDSRGSELGP